MRDECALVDAITATPTILLDLNSASPGGWYLNAPPLLSPPQLDRAVSRTLLADGARIPAAAFDNRTVVLALRCNATVLVNDEIVKAQRLGQLEYRLNLPRSVLRWRPAGATSYTFYRLYRSPSLSVDHWSPADGVLDVTATLLAEPFGLGLPVTVPAVTVTNDPAVAVNGCYLDVDSTTPVNANPYFETNTSDWTGANGATVARTTAQFHEGAASMRVTPDGVTASPRAQTNQYPCTAGQSYMASGWLRGPGVTPTVGVTIRWFSDAGGTTLISTSGGLAAVVASTWTYYTVSDKAPANALSMKIAVEYSGTPTAGQLLDCDEMILGPSAGVGGDVETPARIQLTAGGANMAPVLAVRRHGIVQDINPVLQCELQTLGTDTTNTGSLSAMSNSAAARVSFATNAAMTTRVTASLPYQSGSARTAARGLYRLFVMAGSTASGTTYALRARITPTNGPTDLLLGTTVTWAATDTSRNLIDLGLFQVPVGVDAVYDGYGAEELAGSVSVQIQAQRVSGTASLDLDFLAAMPADEEQCQLGTIYNADTVLDGPNDAVWFPGGSGEMLAQPSAPVARGGSIPMLTPGQPSRIWLLRPDGIGSGWVRGPDTKTRTTTATVTYWPRFLSWAP